MIVTEAQLLMLVQTCTDSLVFAETRNSPFTFSRDQRRALLNEFASQQTTVLTAATKQPEQEKA